MLSNVLSTVSYPAELWKGLNQRYRYGLAAIGVGTLVAMPWFIESSFFMNAIILVFLFAALGHGWNIIGGYAGQISLGHAVMFGTGAYVTAILYVYYGVTPLIGIWIGGFLAMVVGLVLGAIAFRLRGHYFAMVTLAAGLIIHTIAKRWDWLGGATGIEYPFDQIGSLYSVTFTNDISYYYLIGGFTLIVTVIVYVIDRAKLGKYLKAINYDEDAAVNAGLHTYKYKLYAMGISSFITGITGALYAQYTLFINPNSTLRLLRNIDIIMVAIIGGVGTVIGPLLGAAIFIPVREYTRSSLGGSYTGLGWVIFGFALLIISLYRPGGLLNGSQERWDDE